MAKSMWEGLRSVKLSRQFVAIFQIFNNLITTERPENLGWYAIFPKLGGLWNSCPSYAQEPGLTCPGFGRHVSGSG